MRLLFAPAASDGAEAEAAYQPATPNGPAVLDLLRIVCTDALDREATRDREPPVAVIENALDAAPAAPPADLARFQTDVCLAILKHMHAAGILSNGDRYLKTLANLPGFAAVVADRACLLESPLLLEEHVTTVTSMLRQISDETRVFDFVERAFGRSLTTAVADSLFRALNRLIFALFGRLSGKFSPEQLAGILGRLSDAMTLFLGQANPDQQLVPMCVAHVALEAWRRTLTPLLREAWRGIWRQLFSAKQRFFFELTKRSIDSRASAEDLDRDIDRMESLKDQMLRSWHTFSERASAIQARAAKRVPKRSLKVHFILVCC